MSRAVTKSTFGFDIRFFDGREERIHLHQFGASGATRDGGGLGLQTMGPRTPQDVTRALRQTDAAASQNFRFDGLPDLYSFYCMTCDEWHVEEGVAVVNQRPSEDMLGSLTKDAQS
jgi:hypothetical protein